MATFDQKLQEWFISETHLLSDGHLKSFPGTSVLCRLIEGKNKRIWKYVVEHVRSSYNADKVRRVLAVKNSRPELVNPYALADTNQVRKRVSTAEEKRSFLKGSLSELRHEIVCSENEIQRLKDEICTRNQKSAILEVIVNEYKKKCADLNTVKSQLSSYTERNLKSNSQFYLALNFSQTTKNFRREPDSVKYALRQISSLCTELDNSEMSESLAQNLKTKVDQMISTISMPDLLIILKEISRSSYMKLMSKETYSSSEVLATKNGLPNSAKCLQDMKLDCIRCSLNIKATQNEIDALQEARESLLKEFLSKVAGGECDKKFELFEKMAENAGLGESIKFSEHSLKVVRNQVDILKKDIKEKTSKSKNAELAAANFYASFDQLCMLLKSGPSMHEYVLKSLCKLHKYVNEQMFSDVSYTLKEYPFQMEDDLKCDVQTMWSVLERNCVINPVVPCLFSSSSSVPDILRKMLGVSDFHSERVFIRRARTLKEESANNRGDEFEYDNNVLSRANQQYNSMTKMFQKMTNKLELCSGIFLECSQQTKRVKVVIEDRWDQGAQFIPDIEYEGKTLKMWLDILHAIPDF